MCALGQTYKANVIVYDDASSDATWKTVKEFSCRRLRYERGETNLGIGSVRALLADMVTTEYIAWLDSDDLCNKHRVSLQMAVLDEHDAPWCRTSVQKSRLPDAMNWQERPRKGHKGNFMTPSTMVRTSFVQKHRYRPYRCGEDTVWELEALNNYPPGLMLPLVLYYWIKTDHNRLSTHSADASLKGQRELLAKLRREVEAKGINRRGVALSDKYATELVERCCGIA
jgi:glycosyltransferase involved in cell wall biosynthesis